MRRTSHGNLKKRNRVFVVRRTDVEWPARGARPNQSSVRLSPAGRLVLLNYPDGSRQERSFPVNEPPSHGFHRCFTAPDKPKSNIKRPRSVNDRCCNRLQLQSAVLRPYSNTLDNQHFTDWLQTGRYQIRTRLAFLRKVVSLIKARGLLTAGFWMSTCRLPFQWPTSSVGGRRTPPAPLTKTSPTCSAQE
jgi:hypothetical protein